ncbi:hypothetical protein Scep_009287 [Stephania cephalantha]|uniref:Pentatricopeptide repeat-containing protein n=1 Tax=Stephania cephalantha TaxID=152367 RepID=A0AAP0JTE4_9MAGN
MKACPIDEYAKLISKTVLSSAATQSWTPTLEQKLHQLSIRKSLSPTLVARVIDPHLLHHHSLALGFFNWASHQPSFSHTSLTYKSLLKSLSISRQFNSIHALLNRAKSHQIPLHPSLYRSLIASFIIAKRTLCALSTYNQLRQMGLQIAPQTCNSLLSALASDDHLAHARKVFDEMLQEKSHLLALDLGGVELGATLSLLDEVIQRGGDSVVNGSIVALLVVDGLCRVSRVCEASTLLDELRSRGYKPDFIAYRVVAEGFRLGGRVLEAEKVLKRKRKYGVAPRASDYREFLFGLISERRSWEAKELGEAIIGGNFPIEDDVLNALIGSVSAIDPDSATAFCRYMIEKGRSPTILTLTNLSKSLCKNGKVDDLLEIFMVLSSKDYFSDVESYTMMVSYLCTAGLVKEAYRFLKEMKRKGFVPDVSLYNALMEACCREDLLRPAKRLWDEMFASGCQGNLKTYNTLIRKLSESGEAEDANRLFRHMLEKGLVPDSTTYVSLLEGLCQETKIQAACEIFNKCIQQDILLAKTVLTALVLSLCKEGHLLAASKVIQGLIPESGNASCHVLLLRCFVEAGEFQMAIEHMKWIKDTAPSISQVLSSELVASLSYSLKPEPILQLLRLLKENDMVPDNDTWMDLWNGSNGKTSNEKRPRSCAVDNKRRTKKRIEKIDEYREIGSRMKGYPQEEVRKARKLVSSFIRAAEEVEERIEEAAEKGELNELVLMVIWNRLDLARRDV